MIVTLLSWIYIFVICFLCGLTVLSVLERFFKFSTDSPDVVLVTGICFSTVYAEVWSIFGPVSLLPNVVLMVLALVSAVLNRLRLKEYFSEVKNSRGFLIRTILAAIFFSALSSEIPSDYDTYLYHAQSIAWIEKFGCVLGQANLHNRFGYNSAFMCLQALFSLSFAGRSLHQMNGFLSLFMTVFAVESLLSKKGKESEAKDIVCFSALFYILFMIPSISSPGSDMMTMLLLLYLFAKWADLNRKGIRIGVSYGYLAMLALFLSTVKLSAAPVFLLAVYPVYLLIREKRVSDIAKFICLGTVIVIPFIIRNVIISGYLLYPMESIDLFNVDWKVPAGVAVTDRNDITAFGRAVNDIEGPVKLTGWIQIWFRNLEFIPRLLFCVAVFSLCVFAVVLLRQLLKKEQYEKKSLFTALVSAVTFFYWFLTAPTMRYGIVIVLLLSALVFGLYISGEGRKAYIVFMEICALVILLSYSGEYLRKNINLVFPEDYASFECREVVLTKDGAEVTIYTPVEGDRAGIDVFPATPEINPDYTELRGKSMKDGFRAIKQ